MLFNFFNSPAGMCSVLICLSLEKVPVPTTEADSSHRIGLVDSNAFHSLTWSCCIKERMTACFPLFLRDISPFRNGEQLFFIQLVFNFYLMWRKNSDHSQKCFNDRKMVSWLIISYLTFPLEHLQMASMGGLLVQVRGRPQGLGIWGVSLEQKTQEQKATIRGTFRCREK